MNPPALTKEEISRLLPFRVNGSLSEPETRAVQSALAESRALRDEELILTALRAEMRATDSPLSPGEFGLARLNRAIAAEGKQVAPDPRPWPRMGIAAALVALVAAGVFMLRLSEGKPEESDLYQQASGGAVAGQLTVGFDRAATQAAVEALLLRHDLRIVDGPSALGLYQIRTLDGRGLEKALAALRAADRIVETAEPTD